MYQAPSKHKRVIEIFTYFLKWVLMDTEEFSSLDWVGRLPSKTYCENKVKVCEAEGSFMGERWSSNYSWKISHFISVFPALPLGRWVHLGTLSDFLYISHRIVVQVNICNACEVFKIVLTYLECLINVLMSPSSSLFQTNVLFLGEFILLVWEDPVLFIIMP